MIGIIGAGITGLALSAFLEERGVPHLVLEAGERPGGVIRSTVVDGHILDHGPQRTRVTPELSRLLKQIGLDDEIVEVSPDLPLFVCRQGRLRQVPFAAHGLLRTNLISTRGKLRALMEPLTRSWTDEETVGAFVSRKFGREVYENLMGPLFGGLYGSDPGKMYVRHSLATTMERMGISRSILWRFLRGSFNRAAAPAAISFREGMEALPRALYHFVSHRVHLSTPTSGLRRGPGGVGWRVFTEGGGTLDFDGVVLTIPSERAAELLQEEAPESAARLRLLRYNRLAVVHLKGESGRLHGLGYQVAYGSRIRTRGVTWNDSALGRPGVFTAYLGGARDPDLLKLDDGEIAQIARQEFREVTGLDTEPLNVSRMRVPSWDRSWTVMEQLSLPDGVHLCSNYESRVGIPGRITRASLMARELAGLPALRPKKVLAQRQTSGSAA
ncbi:MAG: protoporphyrinogen oxidase [Gemmatimonadales bacterium]|nr:MAG: protoporphyrinogen oxidase [Gemmatimonadales bacterium]